MQNTARLEQAVSDIRKRHGDHTVMMLSEYQTAQALPSGFPALDELLGCGGIPRGRITAFCGRASSGRTTLVQRITAHLQRDLDVSAYFDLSGTFDGESATRCGIDLNRLLILRPEDLKLLPDMLRTLLALHVHLIVLDASATLKSPVLPEWLAKEIMYGRSAVLMLHPFGQMQKVDRAAMHLEVERVAERSGQDETDGWQVRVTVLASRSSAPGGQVVIDLPMEDV